jgi:ATP-GRASP peptide maturase of grasp-with-spasm system
MKKYILIIAEDGDVTVDEVIQWILYFKTYEVIRINDTDLLDIVNIEISAYCTQFNLTINNSLSISSHEIHSYWYRRGTLNFKNVSFSEKEDNLIHSIRKYYALEKEHVLDTLHFLLETCITLSLNKYHDLHTNKLINLKHAVNAGLNIPQTIVTNDKNKIINFVKEHGKCLMKPIRYPGYEATINNSKIYYSQMSNVVNLNEICEILDIYKNFQPTQFQKYINKEFEIRTFYLDGDCYSMAIFSQKNEKTKIDFRNYDEDFPNRNSPFKLPKIIEGKISKFCNLSKINCGSIDFLYSQNDYFFLEINPIGQLQWLSKNCNYNLEYKIALALTK